MMFAERWYQNPLGFWLLIALLPLLLLYLMKKYHRPLLVPSNILWARATENIQADRLWQRLKMNLLLLLQLIMIVSISMMASESGCYSQQTVSQNICFVLDKSLSMAVKEKEGSRLDLAKERIVKIMNKAPLFSKFALVTAGRHPLLLQPWTDNQQVLVNQLEDVEIEYGQQDLEADFALAGQFTSNNDRARVFVLSDQANDLGQSISIGSRRDNMALKTVRQYKGNISLAVGNYSQTLRKANVEYYVNQKFFDVQTVEVAAQAQKLVNFSNIPEGQLHFVLKMLDENDEEVEDALIEDNTLYLNNPVKSKHHVVLVGVSDPFTPRVLDSLLIAHHEEIDFVEVEDYKKRSAFDKSNDIFVVFSNRNFNNESSCHTLVLNPPMYVNDVKLSKISGTPSFFHVKRSDPYMRFCQFSNCLISAANTPSEPQKVEALVSDSLDNPLIFKVMRGELPLLVASFSMEDTNLAARPVYPFLLANIFNEALNRARRLKQALSVGESIINLPSGTLINADNDVMIVGSEWVLKEPGFYTFIDEGKNKKHLAANAFLPGEWDVTPLAVKEKKVILANRTEDVWKELTPYIAFFILILAALEWFLFVKKQRMLI
jgi:Ca-activated chloride channel family protein